MCNAGHQFKIIEYNGFNALALKVLCSEISKLLLASEQEPEQASALHSTFSRAPEENTRTFGRKSQGDDMAAPGASAVWLSSFTSDHIT